jgi:hypothetical protein
MPTVRKVHGTSIQRRSGTIQPSSRRPASRAAQIIAYGMTMPT